MITPAQRLIMFAAVSEAILADAPASNDKPTTSEDPTSYCCWENYMHANRHEADCKGKETTE